MSTAMDIKVARTASSKDPRKTPTITKVMMAIKMMGLQIEVIYASVLKTREIITQQRPALAATTPSIPKRTNPEAM